MNGLPWTQHLILLPILLPLLAGAALISGQQARHGLVAVNLVCNLIFAGLRVDPVPFCRRRPLADGLGVYLAANWQAPFGIALLVDRLSALLLLLTALLSLAVLVFSYRGWGRIGVHFHSLFLFLLTGINGAF